MRSIQRHEVVLSLRRGLADDAQSKLSVGSLITTGATVVAAILAAYASITASMIEGAVTQTIVAEQESTKNLISRSQQETQSRISALQEQTKREIASENSSVERVKAFSELVDQIADPKKSSIALLVLWKLFEGEKERRLVVAAALAVRNESILESLSLLGDDVEPYLVQALKSKNTDVVEAADEALTLLTPDTETSYLIGQILDERRSNPFSQNVKSLISVAKDDDSVKATIRKKAQSLAQNKEIFHYILYRAGDRKNFEQLISGGIEQYAAVSDILRFGEFDETEWMDILDLTIEAVESGVLDRHVMAAAMDILGDHQVIGHEIGEARRNKITALTVGLFLDSRKYQYIREPTHKSNFLSQAQKKVSN